MWSIFAFLAVLQSVSCMRNADETEWNRYGYLVKVLSQSPTNESQVIGCTGTLITPSLVLTSSKCIAADEGEVGNAIVIFARGQSHRKRAVGTIKRDDNIAILEINRIKDEMCPPPPAPVRISRLPVNVSLNSVPWNSIDLDTLPEKKCRINGFETKNVTNFSTDHITMQTDVQLMREGDAFIVEVAENTPICWDDIGLPLECMLDDVTWTQVGFLESVTRAVNEDEPDEAIPVTCESITKFTFWIFNTDDLPKLLEEYSMDVLASASRCFHRYKTFRALTSGLENN
ncbi:hypothetical protein Q1695_001009 [Nippostrongylus brasiliensis]|nr:hypothetical protein Q1695_001009 [Nippostrongylus brasiliensis]